MRRLGRLESAGTPTIGPEPYGMAQPSLTIRPARVDTPAGDPGADAVRGHGRLREAPH